LAVIELYSETTLLGREAISWVRDGRLFVHYRDEEALMINISDREGRIDEGRWYMFYGALCLWAAELTQLDFMDIVRSGATSDAAPCIVLELP
jgi:hypothetical protein